MLITCLGHAKFLLELDDGLRLVTDPFDAQTGYPLSPLQADVVLVSHGHHDHNALDTITGYTNVIDAPGLHTITQDITVEALEAYHDDKQGALRGKTLLFLVQAEGLRIAHLGDLGHLPNEEQISKLKNVDVLMVPVGGYYTIDAAQAKQVCDLLTPRIILPMHYRTKYNASWPIAPVEEFTSLFPSPAERVSMLRITPQDLSCQPKLAILAVS